MLFQRTADVSQVRHDNLSPLHVISIDGHDFEAIRSAFAQARATKGRPTAIIAHTVKGKGISFMENVAGWHGVAPNDEDYERAISELGGK